MTITRERSWRLSAISLGLVIASLGAVPEARAVNFDTGSSDLKVRWDNTIKYSVAYRLNDPDEDVAAGDPMTPAFLAPGRQLDDGDRNFDRGIVSNRLDLFSEFDLTYKQVGLRLSGAAWFDEVYNRGNDNDSDSANTTSVPAGEFSDRTRDMMGRKAELLDAFVFLRSDSLSETPYTVRLGKHTVLYGESLFFGANGIANAQAPIDLIKLLNVPGSQFKEIIRPVGQLSTQIQVSSAISVGAYYQYDWEKNRLPPSGSYLSDVDFVGAGTESLLPGTPVGMNKVSDLKPDAAQGGLQIRFRPESSDVEYGFYIAQYNDKNPAIMMNLGQNFRFVYPEKIRTVGASFSTVFGEANIAGEVSYRWNAPIVSAPQVDIGLKGNSTDNPLYAKGKTLHAQVSGIYLMGRNALWDGAELLGELAWNRTLSITDNPLAVDPNVSRDAMAFRMIFAPQYFQVLPGLDLSVPIGLGYNPYGKSSAVFKFNGGAERGGDFSIGVKGEYQRAWKFAANFTHYFGDSNAFLTPNTTTIPGLYMQTGAQSLHDRDFVSFSIQRTF